MTKDLDNALDAAALAKGKPDPSQPVDMVMQNLEEQCRKKSPEDIKEDLQRGIDMLLEENNMPRHKGFTPGPWKIIFPYEDCDNPPHLLDQNGNQVPLMDRENPLAKENRDLIADAPRLAQREVELMAEVERLKSGLVVKNEMLKDHSLRLDKAEATNKDLLAALEDISYQATDACGAIDEFLAMPCESLKSKLHTTVIRLRSKTDIAKAVIAKAVQS